MNRKIILSAFMALLFAMQALYAQQAIQIETLLNKQPGEHTVKIDFSGFTSNLSAISLVFSYDTDLLTYTGSNLLIPGDGLLTNPNYGPGEFGITWWNNSGASVDGTFIELTFDYAGFVDAPMIFLISECEIADAGANIIPNDSIDYLPGGIYPECQLHLQIGSDPAAGIGNPVSLPVTILGGDFEDINSMQLEIGYDPLKPVSYTHLTLPTKRIV